MGGQGISRPQIAYAVGGALAVSMLLLLIALLHFWVLGRPLSASIGAPLATLHPHRRGDHGRLDGFALRGTEAETDVRLGSGIYRREHGLLLVNPLQRESSEIAQLVLRQAALE